MVLHVTGLQVRGYVFRLLEAFGLLEEGHTVCPPWIDFVRLTILAVEAPKLTHISLSEP